MTENEFLALPLKEQDDLIVLKALGWREWLGEWQNEEGTRFFPVKPSGYVNGDGNAFFEMWDALPREYGWTYQFWERRRTEGTVYCVQRMLNTRLREDGIEGDSPTIAVALALLKAKGVID